MDGHTGDIGSLTAKKFGISRTAVARYMRRLVDEGVLVAEGNTTARRYKLKPLTESYFEFELSPGLAEDAIFRFRILPHLEGVKQNVIDVCQYGFTEMLNNAMDHSGGKKVHIGFTRTYTKIEITVADDGVGIFEKIQKDFSLEDPRSALLELSKGKITSEPARHSGEGIFFTSRMFDEFKILSGNLFYARTRQDDDDWLVETHDHIDYAKGTTIQMMISTDADWTTADVFSKYQDDHILFRRTHVPVRLGRYPGEQLVSRSQAKRILARFSEFSEVMLDFDGVQQIGQPFADEIFRVFANAHPTTRIVPMRTSLEVKKMIDYVMRPDQETKNSPAADKQ